MRTAAFSIHRERGIGSMRTAAAALSSTAVLPWWRSSRGPPWWWSSRGPSWATWWRCSVAQRVQPWEGARRAGEARQGLTRRRWNRAGQRR
uniref:Uncharacterized protein n=1 Tax=Arundo donax TaxID=35708 RepID=A0A0A9C517_ARUDO